VELFVNEDFAKKIDVCLDPKFIEKAIKVEN
jgi:hypothetical protein